MGWPFDELCIVWQSEQTSWSALCQSPAKVRRAARRIAAAAAPAARPAEVSLVVTAGGLSSERWSRRSREGRARTAPSRAQTGELQVALAVALAAEVAVALAVAVGHLDLAGPIAALFRNGSGSPVEEHEAERVL